MNSNGDEKLVYWFLSHLLVNKPSFNLYIIRVIVKKNLCILVQKQPASQLTDFKFVFVRVIGTTDIVSWFIGYVLVD